MRILTKLILVSIGGFLVCVIIFAFLIRPNLNGVGQLYDTGIVKQTKLKALSEQIIAFKNSESDLNAVTNIEKILNSILPRINTQVVIREVEEAAFLSSAQEGMTIQENEKGEEVSKVITGNADIEEVPYTINVSGTYPSLVTFLQYFEHLPHFTEVTDINFGTSTTNTGTSGLAEHSDNLTGSINAVFFIRKTKP